MPPKDPTVEEARAYKQARTKAQQAGPPMTLGNMRSNGVRSLSVYCHCCHHEVEFNVDHMPGRRRGALDWAAHGVHAVRFCRGRRTAELSGDIIADKLSRPQRLSYSGRVNGRRCSARMPATALSFNFD
jgi:hypothetical protein